MKSNNSTNETEGECQEMSTKCDDSSTADSALDEDTSHAVESQNNDIDQVLTFLFYFSLLFFITTQF